MLDHSQESVIDPPWFVADSLRGLCLLASLYPESPVLSFEFVCIELVCFRLGVTLHPHPLQHRVKYFNSSDSQSRAPGRGVLPYAII